MTFTFTFGDLVTLATLLIGSAFFWWKLNHRLERVESGLKMLPEIFHGIFSLIGILVNVLHRRKAIDDESFYDIQKHYAQIIEKSLNAVLAREARKGNPLTPEEQQNLRNYIDKIRRGEWLSSAEVDDYNRLVRKLEHEHPNDPGIWPLIALGAFLLGLYLGSQK